MEDVAVYPNECVEEVVAAIPPGHYHLRLALRFCDGRVIVMHEATVAAIVRAYIDIVTHPMRRGVILRLRRLPPAERKHGYAEWQLLEEGGEDEAVEEITRLLSSGRLVSRTTPRKG